MVLLLKAVFDKQPYRVEIWFDLQMPRGATFFLAAADVTTGKEVKYKLERNEWSIHFNISPDQKLFCGDGGDPG